MTGAMKWFDTAYVPKGWQTINIPGYWEDQGIKDLNGVVWYRKEIDVPASMIGKPAKVFLGRIVDADVLYINGKQVGNTTYQYPQRRYNVPADVLKAGKNIFVIKVTNNNGKGGFVPDKPYCIFAGNDTIDLKGYWQYKVGEVYEPRTWWLWWRRYQCTKSTNCFIQCNDCSINKLYYQRFSLVPGRSKYRQS